MKGALMAGVQTFMRRPAPPG